MKFLDLKTDYAFKKAFEIANEANLTKEELELQYKRKEFISIQKLAIVKAKNEGLQEGLEKGKEEGKKEKAIEIAKNLLKSGVDDSIVQVSTGLDKDEIDEIKKNIKSLKAQRCS